MLLAFQLLPGWRLIRGMYNYSLPLISALDRVARLSTNISVPLRYREMLAYILPSFYAFCDSNRRGNNCTWLY
jgi:hypothetical protein